jgi:hypothetical protein
VPALKRPPRHRADDRVQARAVSAAGEHADLHVRILSVLAGSPL